MPCALSVVRRSYRSVRFEALLNRPHFAKQRMVRANGNSSGPPCLPDNLRDAGKEAKAVDRMQAMT